MARHNSRIIYLDGFAGPGVYSKGEPGSPVIAVTAAIEQVENLKNEIIFFFVEEDQERFTSLESELADLELPARFIVRLKLGDCNSVVGEVLAVVEAAGASLAPTFAFLDPFGFSDTPMSLIKRLMAHPRCEVLITFMFEEINRFLSHKEIPHHFDELFGTDEWREALSLPSPVKKRSFLKALYQRQLKNVAAIRHVLAFEMRNKTGALDYILFFGTNSPQGLKKMKEAMWKVDSATGFTFSDATDPQQEVMFGSEPDTSDIRRRILARFRGRIVAVEDIEKFVLEETPYRETHYKRVLKSLELDQVVAVPAESRKRRGTYPDGTVLHFE